MISNWAWIGWTGITFLQRDLHGPENQQLAYKSLLNRNEKPRSGASSIIAESSSSAPPPPPAPASRWRRGFALRRGGVPVIRHLHFDGREGETLGISLETRRRSPQARKREGCARGRFETKQNKTKNQKQKIIVFISRAARASLWCRRTPSGTRTWPTVSKSVIVFWSVRESLVKVVAIVSFLLLPSRRGRNYVFICASWILRRRILFPFFSIGLSKFLSSLGCFHLTRHALGGARRGRPNQVLLLLLLLLLLFFISFCCRCCRCCCGSSSIRSAKEKRGERTKKSWLNYSGGDRAREPVDRRTHTAVTWTTMTRLGQTNQNADRKRRKKNEIG